MSYGSYRADVRIKKRECVCRNVFAHRGCGLFRCRQSINQSINFSLSQSTASRICTHWAFLALACMPSHTLSSCLFTVSQSLISLMLIPAGSGRSPLLSGTGASPSSRVAYPGANSSRYGVEVVEVEVEVEDGRHS
jgi:hypothetical protein